MGTITKVNIGGNKVRFERRKVGGAYQNVYKPHVGSNRSLTSAQKSSNVYMSSLIKKGVSRYGSIGEFKAAGIKTPAIRKITTSMKVLDPIDFSKAKTTILRRKESLLAQIKAKASGKVIGIKPGAPTIISQDMAKKSKLPLIIGGAGAVILLISKLRK